MSELIPSSTIEPVSNQNVIREELRSKLLAGLSNLTPVCVESIERIELEFKIQIRNNRFQTRMIMLNGQSVGILNPRGKTPESSFPLKVRGLRLNLSNSQVAVVYDQKLTVIVRWVPHDGGYHPETSAICSDTCVVADSTQEKLTWQEAQALKIGDTIGGAHTFQWVDNDWLTNRKVWLPRRRPIGPEWHLYPVAALLEGPWNRFLTELAGKFVGQILAVHRKANKLSGRHK